MMLFSATYETAVMEFAEAIIRNPVIIRLRREEESLENIKQYYVHCNTQEDKYQAIANIYGVLTIGQAMIFCHVSRFKLHHPKFDESIQAGGGPGSHKCNLRGCRTCENIIEIFFCKKCGLSYVGETVDLRSRMAAHHRTNSKIFDNASQ